MPDLVREYQDKLILPGPLMIIELGYRILIKPSLTRRFKNKGKESFSLKPALLAFETAVVEKFLVDV